MGAAKSWIGTRASEMHQCDVHCRVRKGFPRGRSIFMVAIGLLIRLVGVIRTEADMHAAVAGVVGAVDSTGGGGLGDDDDDGKDEAPLGGLP